MGHCRYSNPPVGHRNLRHVLPYPLSRDQAKFDRLKSDLVMYRLAFGQPRQEDLLNLLRRREIGAAGVPDILDLRP
ncbi:hypothetical protein [Micromonospora sp. NPDC047074]|uniref:hypothetical protein n=1 Tax=Micromonospora sp. NPDC047074 TaxID=3154339 RepID=UPI0033DCD842